MSFKEYLQLNYVMLALYLYHYVRHANVRREKFLVIFCFFSHDVLKQEKQVLIQEVSHVKVPLVCGAYSTKCKSLRDAHHRVVDCLNEALG